tara:strand:- start:1074 stop:2036 length:963 start_codon:yes stop_codon:yes gene_type:complete
MNSVKDFPIDVEEIRLWANGFKEENRLSWSKLAEQCDIPSGTLQPFCKDNYAGDNDRIARDLFRFRQTIESKESHQQAIPVDPGYFETETSLRIRTLLQIAHMGRITVVATGPGTGKDMTAIDYKDRAGAVWLVTMMKSCAKITPMVQQVQRTLAMDVRYGNMASSSRAVMERIRGRNGLLIINEAQHLVIDSFEEIRAWHDETGVGVCFMGNTDMLTRIESGRQSDEFARLNSRIAHRHLQPIPLREDVDTFCDAWGLRDPAIRQYLRKIALTQGSGGLRECRQLIEAGSMIARGEQRGLTISDLRDAQSQRATRWIVA